MHRQFATALALVLALLMAGPVLGHFGGGAYILVSADHVNPGEPFEVVVADLTAGSEVVLEVRRDGTTLEVGRTVSDTQGHFTTSATIPVDYANGYTELVATAQDGTYVSTWILVGPRTADSGSPPVSSARPGGIDPSLLVLGVLLVGSIGSVGYLLIRRQRSVPPPVAPRRAVARKRPRRRPT